MIYNKQPGVPSFQSFELHNKQNDYALLIPIINEGERIILELQRAKKFEISTYVDIIICDGGSSDGCTDEKILTSLDVNTILIKTDYGKQSAQLRMGIWWALQRGYKGIITIDGNNKDSIEDCRRFVEKLNEGYDFIQGSRFISGGLAVNTPLSRLIAIKTIHAPFVSMISGHKFTDTTNAFRGYSSAYLKDERVQPLRDCFVTYELLAYLSVRASQLGMKVCEIPVSRIYPPQGKIPTKISPVKGNCELMVILLKTAIGQYNPNNHK